MSQGKIGTWEKREDRYDDPDVIELGEGRQFVFGLALIAFIVAEFVALPFMCIAGGPGALGLWVIFNMIFLKYAALKGLPLAFTGHYERRPGEQY